MVNGSCVSFVCVGLPICTTNAIESVNMGLRTLTKNRGSFPSDEALPQLLYLAQSNIG